MPRCSYLTPLFLASLSLSPPVSPTDPVCSLVNLKGRDAQEAPKARGPGLRGAGPEADFPFSFHFQEGGREGSLFTEPQENLPASPPREQHQGLQAQPRWESHPAQPELSVAPRAAGDKPNPGGPPTRPRKAPNPALGPLGLFALHALGPPAKLFPLKVTGLSTPGIFTHQTGPVSSTHHKYAF